MSDWFADVLAFHEKFTPHLIGTTPALADDIAAELREVLIYEESSELREAIQDCNLPEIADAIADLIYVALGTAVTYGIDPRPIWDAVHTANMRKTGGGLRADGKVCKPPGWTPPDVAGLLARQGPIRGEGT